MKVIPMIGWQKNSRYPGIQYGQISLNIRTKYRFERACFDIGFHKMAYKVASDHDFSWKCQNYSLYQLEKCLCKLQGHIDSI